MKEWMKRKFMESVKRLDDFHKFANEIRDYIRKGK